MAYYKFKEDLIEGEDGEITVIEHLKKLGGTLLHQNKDNRYDALIERNGEKIKYEIKTDVYCEPHSDRGNLFVEVECRGKKSGIIVTEAEWFVTYFKYLNEIWYIKTKDLLKLIEENSETLYKTKNSGDANSGTSGWLIPRHNFLNNFKVYDSKTLQRKTIVKKGEKGKIDYQRLMKLLNK